MNHSLLPFFRVLQNVFACIFFLLQLCFYNCNICVTFSPFYYRKVLQTFFSNVFTRKRFLLLFVDYYKCFLCNFLFLLQFYFCNCKCRRYFFLFLSKGLFKRFFLSQTLVFCCVYQNVFACIFSCCNFVFLFLYYLRYFSPFVTERFLADFSTAFSPKTAYFLPFCGIPLAVHVHCKKSPLVVLGNCRFIYNFFVTVVLFFTIYYQK